MDSMPGTHDMSAMSFYFSSMVKNFLFDGLTTKTAGALVGVLVVLAVLCVGYEGIRVLREYIFLQTNSTCCDPPSGEISRLWPCGARITRGQRIRVHAEQTLLHVLQVTIGYVLMLCVMSYNAWMLIVVVLSIGIGYFSLGALISKEKFFVVTESKKDNDRKPSLSCHDQRTYSTISTVSQTVAQ